MSDLAKRVKELYTTLHQIPEVGFNEFKTSAFLAKELEKAGYIVTTGLGGTGVVGTISGTEPGPTIALRADMDALEHLINDQKVCIHSCGHDSHAAMVLTAAEEIARRGIKKGKIKIIFQPAEEKLFGAVRMIEDKVIEDVDYLLGIHLRPIQEAKLGQAAPALYHGASYIMEAVINGAPAHGARPHLGINAIDAGTAAVNAINAIHTNPTVPATVKVTKFHAGGISLNAIPEKAELALDLRAQTNEVMEMLLDKATKAIEAGAATVGATATAKVKGGCPAAIYDDTLIEYAKEAISNVLGEDGLLPAIITPGGEDFHFYAKHKPNLKAAYIGLGADLTPGLHHPEMKFNTDCLVNGVNILLKMVDKIN